MRFFEIYIVANVNVKKRRKKEETIMILSFEYHQAFLKQWHSLIFCFLFYIPIFTRKVRKKVISKLQAFRVNLLVSIKQYIVCLCISIEILWMYKFVCTEKRHKKSLEKRNISSTFRSLHGFVHKYYIFGMVCKE